LALTVSMINSNPNPNPNFDSLDLNNIQTFTYLLHENESLTALKITICLHICLHP